ncbi:MAG: MerR family transcriptional regulator [Cellulosilyticaceae bacterium]
MKSYYKIGEISKIYGIGKDSLMYYEELGILEPTRGENGYRFYSISDIWKLNLIKELRSLDFPMKKIKDYLDDRNLTSTKEILNEEVRLIDDKIAELLKHRNNIKQRLASIDEVVQETRFEQIEVKVMPLRKALLLNANITRDEEVDFLIQKLQKEYEDRFYILGNNNIGAVFNFEKVKQQIYTEFNSVFCLLPPEEVSYNFVLEQGEYVVCSYRGHYRKNKGYLQKMLAYIESHGYKIQGEPIEIYKIDIHETGEENEFVTEIQIPVGK